MDTLGVDWSSVIIESSSDAILSIIRGDTEFALYPVTTVADRIDGGELDKQRSVPIAGQLHRLQARSKPSLIACRRRRGAKASPMT